jgi:iron complex outermembrane receptor protein
VKSARLVYLLLCLTSLLSITIQSVQAQEISNTSEAVLATSRVRDQKRPATTIKEWLAQVEAVTTSVMAVRLEPSNGGLDIVLEAADGKTLQVDATQFKATGKTLTANISGATLTLPDGKEFWANNPTSEIATVSVTQIDFTTRVVGK